MFSAAIKSGAAGNPTDPKFNYVTMLLHGNGTNGAQNNTFVDSSTNNFTITRNGNTTQGTFTPYGSNWSNYFDGSGDFLTLPDNAAFGFGTGNFTFEFWLYYTGGNGYTCFFTNNSTSGNYIYYGLNTGTRQPFVWNDGNVLTTSANVTNNTWQHHAIVRNGSTLTIYLDGVAIGSTTWNVDLGSSRPLSIGAVNTAAQPTAGYISNFRAVKSAVYTSAFTPPTAPLTAITNTSLLTCQSNRFIDNSSNNFTITRNGDVSVQRFSPFSPSTAYSTSVIGGSGYFDGSGDYLTAAANTAFVFGTGDFTIEAWFYATLWPTDAYVVSNLSSGNTSWSIEIYGGNIRFSGWTTVWLSATQPSTSAWHHVAVSRSGTTLSMFVDGTRVATTTNSTNFSANNTLVVGDYIPAGGANFNGYISNVRLVKGTAVYSPSSSTLTVPTAPLTAISGTSFLGSFTNAGILDNAMMNDLETVGNAQISTSVKKYGTGSMYFDGTGDGLQSLGTPNTAFGTGDFTVEFWINLAANLGNYVKIIEMGLTGSCFTIETQSTLNTLNVTDLNTTVFLTSSSALTTGTWIHVAVTRASGTLRIFQNGTQTGSVANSTNFANSGSVYIGQSNSGQAMNGYIDDLRITKGYARYTANFTAPTAAFPNN